MRSTLGLLLLIAGGVAACGEKRPPTTAPVSDFDVPDRAGPDAGPARASASSGGEPRGRGGADEASARGDAAGPGTRPPGEPPQPEPQPQPPAFDPAPTLALMGWGADTRSMALRSAHHVYPEPSMKGEPLGKIIEGSRLPIREGVAGTTKACKAWLAVAPAGWICARGVAASVDEPLVEVQPPMPPGALLPQEYYNVVKGAQRFKDEAAVEAGTPLPEPKAKSAYMVTRDDEVDIDGVTYAKTAVGLIASDDLRLYRPSTFAGMDLHASPPPSWPFAWVVAKGGSGKRAKELAILATPDRKGAEVGVASYRSIVPVLEETDDYVRIGSDQWLPKSSVGIARRRTRPAGAGDDGRWIDVDRDQQVMIAYDHDEPVYATLVATGIRKTFTPPAIYRLRSKAAVTKMGAEESEAAYYMVSEVPWATRFRSGLYFHAAYWHDDFGHRKSHGCVNLAPRDAKWVYDWTTPTMPPGWSELEVPLEGAMIVRVYDEKAPDPPVFDYAKEAIERVTIRKREQRLKEEREAREAAEAAEAAGLEPAPATP
ncbi:MAG TPA: L,D-transpeptidase [Kofleriaceae bacterium]|nr:L,D-transpeptidase [Kofleriaceae bacterium]